MNDEQTEKPTGPTIFRTLDLSTAHLTEVLGGDDAGILTLKGVNVQSLTHGFLLLVPDNIDERITEVPDIPEIIVGIWRFAKHHDCAFVLIDADADTVDELPTYDW